MKNKKFSIFFIIFVLIANIGYGANVKKIIKKFQNKYKNVAYTEVVYEETVTLSIAGTTQKNHGHLIMSDKNQFKLGDGKQNILFVDPVMSNFDLYSIIITYVPGFVVETSSSITRDKLFPTWKLRTVFLPVGSVTVSIALLPISSDITKLTSTISPSFRIFVAIFVAIIQGLPSSREMIAA